MKKIYYSFATALLIAASFVANAQTRLCATDEMVAKSLHDHPELKKNLDELERFTEEFIKNMDVQKEVKNKNGTTQATYVIPVVFHILHEYGTENISNAQIKDAVRILNEDFQKLNADQSIVVSQFQSIIGNASVEFRLAQKDPNGNCHTGIDRIVTPETNVGDDGSKLNPWPYNKYLNIWSAKKLASGAAGYSYYPGSAPSGADGVMILSNYIGSIGSGNVSLSRALTHEVGHWLNLAHTWGSTNQPGVACGGSDNVSDTPPTMGWTTCNLQGATCGSPLDNVQNFMEYSYCCRMFTAGQCTRMNAALNSATAGRNNLHTTANLTATGTSNGYTSLCAPKADFISNFQIVCEGDAVKFTSVSWMGQAASWSWNCPGGTPATNPNPSDSVFNVTYNTAGTYNVTLTVTNATGNDSKTRTSYIVVVPKTAAYSTFPLQDSYETYSSIPNNDWIINDYGGAQKWALTTTAGATGTKSARLGNATSEAGQTDDLIGPTFDLSNYTSAWVTFKVAYSQRLSADDDNLKVSVSSDCGRSWVVRYNKKGAVLKTAGPMTSAFTPTSSQWRKDSVSLITVAGQSNVRLKFEFISAGGNNIYIDDINIDGVSSSSVNELESNIQLSIYPNPMESYTNIYFTLKEEKESVIYITDVLGKKVATLQQGQLKPGEYNYTLNKNKLESGIYFVRIEMNNKVVTKKLIIE